MAAFEEEFFLKQTVSLDGGVLKDVGVYTLGRQIQTQ